MAYPMILGVPAFKTPDERGQVIGEDGELVATLSPASRRYRFDVQDAAGTLLCRGRLRPAMGWEVVDADGASLVSMGPGFFGRYRLKLRGGELALAMRGRAYQGELRVYADDEHFLINSVPGAGIPDVGADWVIRSDGTLTLAELLGVLELHRLEMRRRRKPSPRRRRRVYASRNG